LDFDEHGTWRNHVLKVFDLLKDDCKIKTNPSCGFHIHVSHTDGTWALSELKQLCVAILNFESAFAALLPAWRQSSKHAKPNSISGKLGSLGREER